MSSLIITHSTQKGEVLVRMSGHINEDSDFSKIKNLSIAENTLILDLEGITLINSCGIREWVEFQKKFIISDKVIYRKCPQVIIEQMNMVSGFIHPNGNIETFFAPYYDPKEDKEFKILLTPPEVINGKAPIKKSQDGFDLEFDDIEAQYFNFLKNKD